MQASKDDTLKRINYIEGHIAGIKKMVNEDQYCVDVLKQTYAVRRAIEKLEALILDGHLRGCVADGIRENGGEAVINELVDLFALNNR